MRENERPVEEVSAREKLFVMMGDRNGWVEGRAEEVIARNVGPGENENGKKFYAIFNLRYRD